MSSPHALPKGLKIIKSIYLPEECSTGGAKFARMWRNGRDLFVAGRTFLMRLNLDTLTPQQWLPLNGLGGEAIGMGGSATSNEIFVGRYPNLYEVRKQSDLSLVSRVVDGHAAEVNSVLMSSDGSRIVSTSRDAIVLRDRTGQIRTRIAQAGYCAAWSPDSSYFLVGSDGSICVFNRDGRPLETLVGHNAEVAALAFIPGTKTFASAAKDGRCCLWRRPFRSPLFSVAAHSAAILALAATPEVLITKGRDNSLRFLDLDDGQVLATYRDLATSNGWAIGMQLDGNHLIVPSHREKRLQILRIDFDRLKHTRNAALSILGPSGEEPIATAALKPIERCPANSLPLFFVETPDSSPSDANTTTSELSPAFLRRIFIRFGLHGLRSAALEEALFKEPCAKSKLILRFSKRTQCPRARDLIAPRLLLGPAVAEDRSNWGHELLLSFQNYRQAIDAYARCGTPISGEKVLYALMTAVEHGPNVLAEKAARALDLGAPSEFFSATRYQILKTLEDHSQDEVDVWRNLRVLRRMPFLITAPHNKAISERLRRASSALKTELYDTLAVAASQGILSLDLTCVLFEHAEGYRARLALGLLHHPEAKSEKLQDAIGAWQRSKDKEIQPIASWLHQRLLSPRPLQVQSGYERFEDELVLNADYLKHLLRMPFEKIPDNIIHDTLRLLWLPLMAESAVPRLARILLAQWLDQGPSLWLSFWSEPVPPRLAKSQHASLRTSSTERQAFLAIAGLEGDSWQRKVGGFFKAANDHDDLNALHWARLILDHKLLGSPLAAIEDTTMAGTALRFRRGRIASRHLARAEAFKCRVEPRSVREYHNNFLHRLRAKYGLNEEPES